MTAVQPRQFVHRGSVTAAGFMIRAGAVSLGEARRRVLDLWQPGLRLKTIDGSLIVLLPTPMRVMAEQAMGEPLLRHGNLLVALPLDHHEIKMLDASRDLLVLARAGQIQTVPFMELPDEDPARWIDTSAIIVADVVTLGLSPETPTFQAPTFDPRRDIPGIPPASSELQRLLADVRQQQATGDTSARPKVLVSIREGVSRLWQFLRRFRIPIGQRIQTPAAPRQSPTTAAPPRTSPIWSRLMRGINQLLNFARLSQLMTSRHARYMSRMMAMLQSGDIDEGLRHAIPLADATRLTSAGLSWFRLPRPRSNLSISLHRSPMRSAWMMDGQWYIYLRNLYRQAFQRLEAQGRIEEAAFVLTELLATHAEAVSFLEKHGRFRLAAEIAEDRKLPPALAIRLWWLAKDRQRAVSLACRTGQFEQAIQHLAGHPTEAEQLRIVWADRLAASGRYLAAAEAVWPVKSERDLVLKYFNQAIQAEGTAAAIALARKGARFPESFEEVLAATETLMAQEDDESARARHAFADGLRNELMTPESQVLARLAVRGLVRDIQRGVTQTPVRLRRLLDFSGDGCLRADVPPVEVVAPERRPLPTGEFEVSAADVGSHPVADLALLADGRLLAALGESGLILLSREGRQIAQWNQPVQRLVVSDDGTRAIGIAHRDGISRLIRFDLLARKAEYWCDTRLSAYCDNFDGSVWCVAEGEDLYLIDSLAQRFEPLWRVPALGGEVVAMQRNRKENRLTVLSANPKVLISWGFDHPSCHLRTKREFSSDPASVEWQQVMRGATVISEEGDIFEQLLVSSRTGSPQMLICQIQTNPPGGRKTIGGKVMGGRLSRVATQGHHMAIPVFQKNATEIVLYDTHTGAGEVLVRLHGSNIITIALRFADNVLLCGDDQGRIVALDMETRKSVRDLRI